MLNLSYSTEMQSLTAFYCLPKSKTLNVCKKSKKKSKNKKNKRKIPWQMLGSNSPPSCVESHCQVDLRECESWGACIVSSQGLQSTYMYSYLCCLGCWVPKAGFYIEKSDLDCVTYIQCKNVPIVAPSSTWIVYFSVIWYFKLNKRPFSAKALVTDGVGMFSVVIA